MKEVIRNNALITATSPTPRVMIAIALMAVYLFWGGTYLAMKVAIHTIPPFLMGGLRFFTASALVFLWQWCKGAALPSPNHW